MALKAASGSAEAPSASGAAKTERRLLVEYLADAAVGVRGVASGRLYRFDAAHRRQHVAEGDAAALLRTAFFKRID